MNVATRCQECGGYLKAGSGSGLCARCLLAAALFHPAHGDAQNLPQPGQRIGEYRVVRLLGEGGMGLVFLAEQEQPITRPVALKVIKLGMDTRAVLARFQSEQQALARMDHPNIAQVYGAGSSPDGRPYFVMEYVPGVPITEYCDSRRLPTRQRLELFLQAAHAVQHAHQKGIIHRDLKPSNILVLERDGEPLLKIIDFGLAKATEKQVAEQTLFTEAGVLIGTPEYMSPEQALGARDIDTRTDIYSLGVLLYELLVGTVPFDSKRLRAAGYDEIRRMIREDDPPLPTRRLESLGRTAGEVALRRSSDTETLKKQVRGDLDGIAMKALEKECARRYASASEMAADIQRHLRDEPVTAMLAGPLYRCRKFVRKNRWAVLGTAAILIFGLAVFSFAYLRVRAERNNALRAGYAANVAAAAMMIEENQPYEARVRLEAAHPQYRNWEWRQLWHASDASLARFRSAGEFHNFPFPSAIAFSGSRTCWDTQTTVECWNGPGYSDVKVVKFSKVLGLSRDAALAITGGDHVALVDVASGKTVSICRDCETGEGAYYAVFSPDDKRIAMPSQEGTIVWDARSGKTLAKIPAGHVMAFSPDAKQLALGSLEVWSVDPARRIAALDSGGYVYSAAFSPDGAQLVSGSSEGAVRVWNLRPMSGPTVLAVEGRQVQAVAFSPDSRQIVATGYDQAIRVWRDGKLVASLPAFSFPAIAVAFSPDGTRLVAGDMVGELGAWDARTYGGQLLPLVPGTATAMAVSPDSRLIAVGSQSGRVALYGIDGTPAGGWLACPDGIQALAFSPDGKRLLTGSSAGAARLWDVASAAPGIELKARAAAITAAAFSPDATRLATGSKDGTVQLWDAATGRAIATIQLRDPVNSTVFSPDGSGLLIAAGDESKSETQGPPLQLFNASTGAVVKQFTGEPHTWACAQCPASQASFSPDGRRVLAAFGTIGIATVWDAKSGAVIARLPDVVMSNRAVFSPDGSRIVTASPGAIRIWDAIHYETLLSMPLRESTHVLAFSPDGSQLLALFDRSVRMWQSSSRVR